MAQQPWKAYGRYGTVGFELLLSIALGWWLGHWLDSKFFPGRWYLTLLFTLAGGYAGLRALFKAAKKMESDMEALDREEARERDRNIERAMIRKKLEEVEREIDEHDQA